MKYSEKKSLSLSLSSLSPRSLTTHNLNVSKKLLRKKDKMTERLFNTCVKYTSRKWDAGEIIKDKLWIGSVQDAKNFEELRKRKIDTMLTAARGLFVFGRGAKNRPDFIKKRLVLKISDHPSQLILDEKVIGRAVEFIRVAMKDPDARILVHCASGVSRSVSMVLSYLITQKMYMNLDDALTFVRRIVLKLPRIVVFECNSSS